MDGQSITSEKASQPVQRKRKIPKIQQSLAFLLESLQGKEIVAELKNDAEVRGTIEKADFGMSLTLLNASQTFPDGRIQQFEQLHVIGSKIRYVHIPKDVKNIHATVTNHVEKLDRNSRRAQPRKIVDRKRSLPRAGEEISLETPQYESD